MMRFAAVSTITLLFPLGAYARLGEGVSRLGEGISSIFDHFSSPPTRPPRPSEGCDPDWQTIESEWQEHRAKWLATNKTDCYNMTLYRDCYCPPDVRGPHYVVVQNDSIVSPSDGHATGARFVPTMNELFQFIYDECIDGCPDSGAVRCVAQYAEDEDGSYVNYTYRDRSRYIADEELGFLVFNLTFCDEQA